MCGLGVCVDLDFRVLFCNERHETKKKSEAMNKCLMLFAKQNELNPLLKEIKLDGTEEWTAEKHGPNGRSSFLLKFRPNPSRLSPTRSLGGSKRPKTDHFTAPFSHPKLSGH